MENNTGATQESIDLMQTLIDNRCGKDSFEARLFRYLKPHIRLHCTPLEKALTHEEEICLALGDFYSEEA